MTHFTGPSEYRLLEETGHNAPQEAPGAVAQAVLDVRQLTGQ
jgi:pimeloyl-ACP methyl ester carboxylesterase